MPIFVALGKLTQTAIENEKMIEQRDLKGEKIFNEAGGKLLAHYYTLGRYYFVIIVDMPSIEAFAKV
jgi:uncharacterized protein with GYD domain